MRIIRLASILLFLLSACGKSENNREDPGGVGSGSTTPVAPTGTGTATGITIAALATNALYTSETAGNSCVPVVIQSLKDGVAIGDVGVTATIVATGTVTDKGTVSPAAAVTDAGGNLSISYCSGKEVGEVTIVVKAGAISANSSKITITKKSVFEFTYVRSDVDGTVANTEGTKLVTLNILDSGPSDCTNIYFKLVKSGSPLAGESLVFGTQVDFPKGSKLGKRADTLNTAIDTKTGKKYAIYTAISSGAGEFSIPVCAGVSLGTLVVSTTFTDAEEGRVYPVSSPVIRITSGLTNYTNFSLTFDPANARGLKAYYNTNSEFDLAFSIQLGARFDGRALPDFPVSFATEVGRYTLENGGIADSDTGVVKAKLHALHLVDNYPYPVLNFGTAYPAAQTRCEPASIALWAQDHGVPEVTYKDLRRNWQSSVTYAVRGQEYFNDANRNGIYDEGGDGFWDKNQNGVFDAGDVLTHDAGNNGFDPSGEWFIDLPTPFVDVNDDKIFTPGIDYLLGDEYGEPNGKRDADAFIWKSEVFPIGMGASPFGLLTREIKAGTGYIISPLVIYGSGFVFARKNLDELVLWGSDPTFYHTYAEETLAFFAHDLCGNVLPGGTKFELNYITEHAPLWGDRLPTAHIYMQPQDQFLEPTRQLLKEATGGSTAVLNFNTTDHPANTESYPIFAVTETPACLNPCTGIVAADPGISCDGWRGRLRLSVTEPNLDQHGAVTSLENPLSWPAVNDCNCLGLGSGVVEERGVCKCSNSNATWDGSACTVPP